MGVGRAGCPRRSIWKASGRRNHRSCWFTSLVRASFPFGSGTWVLFFPTWASPRKSCSRQGQLGYYSGVFVRAGAKRHVARARFGESGSLLRGKQQPRKSPPNSPWSSFSSFLLSPTPTRAKRVRTLGSGLPFVCLAKFPLLSHLSSHRSKLTKIYLKK